MIIDTTRRTAAIHPADTPTYLTTLSKEEFHRLSLVENQVDPFTDLWKSFFHQIEITPVSYTHLDVYKRQVEPLCLLL